MEKSSSGVESQTDSRKKESSSDLKIQREIFQGNALSPYYL